MLVPASLEFSLTPCDRTFDLYAPVCLAFSERPDAGRKAAPETFLKLSSLSTSRLRNQSAHRLSVEVGGVSLWPICPLAAVTFDQKMALQQMQVSAQNVVAVPKPVRIESLCEQTAASLFICLEKQLSNLLSLA